MVTETPTGAQAGIYRIYSGTQTDTQAVTHIVTHRGIYIQANAAAAVVVVCRVVR